ncbi:DUF2155 domain-containing protein [Geminicoccaceae bacterium 1502E]|nr:DUF2155 domain-containing protein [Geminicoccaceae bacterium 1502E]
MRRLAVLGATLLLAAPAAHAAATLPHGKVILQGLDKVTARVEQIELRVGEEILFGSLAITARACLETPPTEPPESAAFLEIDERESVDERIFSGWMFASSPGLSALEHPVYDVWVLDCADPLPAPGGSATQP